MRNIRLSGSPNNVKILIEELNKIKEFKKSCPVHNIQNNGKITGNIGHVDLVSIVISIPLTIFSSAIYDLIKETIQKHNNNRKVRVEEAEE